jgi:hypothetical protein
MNILGIATAVGMVGDLYWTEGGLIDRATACLLLNYTIDARSIWYTATVAQSGISRQRGDADSTWLRTKFGLNRGWELTVISDGKWFALNGNLVENGRVILGNTTANVNGANINTSNTLVFSADASAKLGVGMEDVGRKINIVYRDPDWTGLVQQVYGNFSYADSTDSFMGVGRTGAWTQALADAGDDGRLFVDIESIAGDNVSFADARMFVNYQTNTIAGLNALIDGYGGGSGTFSDLSLGNSKCPCGEDEDDCVDAGDDCECDCECDGGSDPCNCVVPVYRNHSQIGRMKYKIDESLLRVIWDTDREGVAHIRFVFVEYYSYSKFRDEHTDGGNRVMRLHEVFEGEGRGFTNNARLDRVYGYADLELEENDRFISYRIGANKFGVKPIDSRVVTGQVTTIANTQWDGQSLTISGRAFTFTNQLLGASAQVADSRNVAAQPVPAAVTDNVTLYLFNGKIVEIWKDVAPARTTYAVVEKSQRVNTAGQSLTGAATFQYFVRLRLEDNSRPVLRITNVDVDATIDAIPATSVMTAGMGYVCIEGAAGEIDGRMWHYELGDNDTVRLFPISGIASPTTILAAGGALNSQSGRLTNARWNGGVHNTFIHSGSVVFVQTAAHTSDSMNGGVYRAVKGSVPALPATASVGGQYRLGNIPGYDNGGITAMLINLNAALPGDTTTQWAVSLGAVRNDLVGGENRFQLRVLTSDGEVIWLSSKGSTNAFFTGGDNNVLPRGTIFNYILDGDGFIDGANKTKFRDEFGDDGLKNWPIRNLDDSKVHIFGVNPALNFLVMQGGANPANISYHSSAKFYIIDGENSKELSGEEVAALTHTTWRNNGNGRCVIVEKNAEQGDRIEKVFVVLGACVCMPEPTEIDLELWNRNKGGQYALFNSGEHDEWNDREMVFGLLQAGFLNFKIEDFVNTGYTGLQLYLNHNGWKSVDLDFDLGPTVDGWYWIDLIEFMKIIGQDTETSIGWFEFGFNRDGDAFNFDNFGIVEAWYVLGSPQGTKVELDP